MGGNIKGKGFEHGKRQDAGPLPPRPVFTKKRVKPFEKKNGGISAAFLFTSEERRASSLCKTAMGQTPIRPWAMESYTGRQRAFCPNRIGVPSATDFNGRKLIAGCPHERARSPNVPEGAGASVACRKRPFIKTRTMAMGINNLKAELLKIFFLVTVVPFSASPIKPGSSRKIQREFHSLIPGRPRSPEGPGPTSRFIVQNFLTKLHEPVRELFENYFNKRATAPLKILFH